MAKLSAHLGIQRISSDETDKGLKIVESEASSLGDPRLERYEEELERIRKLPKNKRHCVVEGCKEFGKKFSRSERLADHINQEHTVENLQVKFTCVCEFETFSKMSWRAHQSKYSWGGYIFSVEVVIILIFNIRL